MSLIIIDDEEGIRRTLAAYLEDMDYDVLTAENGHEGLEILSAHHREIEAAVVDLNMPVMDGYSFIEHSSNLYPDLPVVVLSGVGIVEDALKAIRMGAWDFITKPLTNLEILHHTLKNVIDRSRLIIENRNYQENLERLVRQRTAELEAARRQIMQRLSRAAEYKDNETGHHVIRVGEISAVLGRAMGLSEEQCGLLRDCVPLHDIGKIGIPDSVLLKPGSLTPEEWTIMRSHSLFGCEILGPLSSNEEASRTCRCLLENENENEGEQQMLRLARIIAMFHHERWDGSGYPTGAERRKHTDRSQNCKRC